MILHTESDTKVEMHKIQGIIDQEGNSFPLSGTISAGGLDTAQYVYRWISNKR